MVQRIIWATLDAQGRKALLARSETDLSGFFDKVRPIIAAVKAEGDAALLRFAREIDGAPVSNLMASEAEFDQAFATLDPALTQTIGKAIENVRAFHEDQRPGPMSLREITPGAWAGDRFTPIRSVALYVPRGKGSFPSVTMMTSVPAVLAGVKDIAIFTPPTPDGGVDAATLVAARLAGVAKVYKCGGAQAVAAAAYGTETISKALKIVGPGSPWVVAAKRLLSDQIDTGLPAGPSECIIFADGTLPGRLAALDLLIEAEHGPDSSAWLVTHSPQTAQEAEAALPALIEALPEPRRSFVTQVLNGRGGILLTPDLATSYAFINDYAPEHLEILSASPFDHLGEITEAAEILLGAHTPVTLANFCLGPNNVLPTSGGARTHGPLSVTDFLKRTSVGYVTAKGWPNLAPMAEALADYEGFPSHARAVRDR
ncbi:histidinol dehydrogenase [Stagnihabitans tardus]|uniref:Histidinol dehydrogenase homolog n=1 Tax=Stagnihabitans tardus TaxID=2699202 RepID=A0AAE4Y9P5_9RHOB|nr:histidinol dehydrogenase [Stagnihabitans tardus]NBZ88602.1 histidinol dehydrogenase [Stagnihabitans tardus]